MLVNGDVAIRNDATVKPMSMIPSGTIIHEFEQWGGSPAQRISKRTKNMKPREAVNTVPYHLGLLQLLLPITHRLIEAALVTPFIYMFQFIQITDSTLLGPAWPYIFALFLGYMALTLALFYFQVRYGGTLDGYEVIASRASAQLTLHLCVHLPAAALCHTCAHFSLNRPAQDRQLFHQLHDILAVLVC